MRYFGESLYESVGQQFRIDEVYLERKTDHQHLMIFRNARLGRVMTLDGVVQTTEADEFIYHEMMAHVPMFAHGDARHVLIVGGGDGGMLREVLKHPVARVTQVEIDRLVVDMAIEYLPNHSAGAYDDPRLNLVIADGLDYVRTSQEKFDVIIVDSTDPVGPGEGLFSEDFYGLAKARLTEGGALVAQNGVPFFQPETIANTHQRLTRHFVDVAFYCAPVPTYYGGFMSFAWATDNLALRQLTAEPLQNRFRGLQGKTRYYNPEIHQASFALPEYVRNQLDGI